MRLCINYISKVSFTDPATLGLQQTAVGDVEVIIIAGRGIGVEAGEERADDHWTKLQYGDLLRVQAQIGAKVSKVSPVGREAPTPIWNEKFALKLPHPASVVECHVKLEDVDGEVSMVPYGTGLIPLGDFVDNVSEEHWIECRAPVKGRPAGHESGILVGSLQVLVTVRRNYGFNMELLGGMMACPWKCGTHFMPDDAMSHFVSCPLAPDPTAQVGFFARLLVCSFVCWIVCVFLTFC